MIKNYLKISYRNLTNHKTYSLINIIGLGVGIACAVLTILWVQYEISFDRFHENADKLFRVVFMNEQGDYHGFYQPGPLANYLEENFPEVKYATNYSEMEWKLSYGIHGFFSTGSFVDSSFFEMFSFPLEEGDRGTVLINPNSVVISRSLAQKMFGQSNPVGKTLKMNDRFEATVTGVFSDVPKTSHMQFDFVIPFSNIPDYMKMWDRKCVNTYVLLRNNVSFNEMNEKISGLMNEHNPTWGNILYLFPITSSHLYEPGGTGPIIYIYIFSVFSFLILIVACINFMNLSTVRSTKRMKEIGIKKTIGSTRIDLIKQFMIETIQLSFIALLTALVLIELCLPYLNNMLGTDITMNYSINMVLVLLIVTLLTGVIAGSYPAIYLSSLKPILILNNRSSKTGEKRSSVLRNALVIIQFSFSVFIITCVLLIGSQLNYIQSRNLGFNKEQVLVISTRGELQKNVPTMKEELLKYPFVQSATVSATNLTDFQGAGTGPIEWEGKSNDEICEVGFNFVDEDFAKTFQVEMKEGRFFSKEYSADMSEAFVVNEATVKAMGIENPLNKNLSTWFGRKGKIVGVIKDFNTQSLRETITPVVFIMTSAANNLCLRLSTTDISSAISSIENKLKEIVPDDPFEYRFLDDHIDDLYRNEKKTGEFATFIAILAIFISCLGLFGLASFSGKQRTKEIGIRKVLGATMSGVLIMLTKDFLKWIILANIIAWPLAYFAMNKWLEDFAYRIDISWWVFVLSGGIALLIALATVSYQAIKAATANPIESLKYE